MAEKIKDCTTATTACSGMIMTSAVLPALKGRSRGHGDCHTNTTESRKMSNPQGSFFVQSFPLKPVQFPAKSPSSLSIAHDPQNPVSSCQSATAGPSSTKSTPSATSPDGLTTNIATYSKERSEEELQIIQQTTAGCVQI